MESREKCKYCHKEATNIYRPVIGEVVPDKNTGTIRLGI